MNPNDKFIDLGPCDVYLNGVKLTITEPIKITGTKDITP